MSSDTPPSIPPRTQSGSETAENKPAGPGTGRGSAPSAPGAAASTTTSPAAGKGAPAASAPARPASARTATATQEAVRPASQTPERPAPASGAARTDAPKPPAAARPAAGPATTAAGPRRVRLAISRVDPWSVMKLSFLISVAIGIMIVVATAVVWLTLDSLEVFARLDGLITEILADSNFDIMTYVEFDRVISVSTLVAVVDVFLITALATIGAFLYNIVAALVGGVHITMTDD